MTYMIEDARNLKTNDLLVQFLTHAQRGERVQFLVPPSSGPQVVQRLRSALTRSRRRNERNGRKPAMFGVRAEFYPYTDAAGVRHECVVMWTEKTPYHRGQELLQDLVERTF